MTPKGLKLYCLNEGIYCFAIIIYCFAIFSCYNNPQRASHGLYLLFTSICWLLPFAIAFLTFFKIDAMIDYGLFDRIISGTQITSTDYTLLHRAVIFSIQLLPLSVTVLICHKLARLFHLYEKGVLFEIENIKIIKQISLLMITGELLQLLYQPLITAALSFNNPAGQRFASITLGSTNASTLITALVILIASWIVNEAHQLKNEVQLTI